MLFNTKPCSMKSAARMESMSKRYTVKLFDQSAETICNPQRGTKGQILYSQII